MKRISEIAARLEAISVEVEALSDVALDAGDDAGETLAQIEKLDGEFNELKAEQARLEKVQARIDEIVASRVKPVETVESVEASLEPSLETEDQPEMKIPAVAARQRSKLFESPQDAYLSGMFLAAKAGNQKASEFMAAQSVGTDDKGGFTVPDPLSNALVNLLEEYGVARRACRRIVMSALTWTVPKVAGHATIYYPAEAASITDSDVTFEQITLTAGKLAGRVLMSTEVVEDSIISMMDTVVQSLAYGISIEEDKNLFNGVAGGINASGIKGDANVADTNVASVAALALTDFTACAVSVGNPIVGARNEWYLNSTLYNGPVRDLLNAAPGNVAGEYALGSRPTLLGAPVNFVNVLPGASASGSGDLLAVYGDLSMGCYFGDRRALNFKTLNELYAETDQVGVVCTERIDIKVANPEVLAKITLT